MIALAYRDLLLHAGRHFGAEPVADVVHFEPGEEAFHPFGQFILGHTVEPPEVFDHLPGGHAVVDGGVGRHETDLAADHRGLCDDVVAVQRGRAGGRLEHGAENPQRGGLSGAVGAEQAVDLAGTCVEVDGVDGDEFASLEVLIVFRQSTRVNHRHPSPQGAITPTGLYTPRCGCSARTATPIQSRYGSLPYVFSTVLRRQIVKDVAPPGLVAGRSDGAANLILAGVEPRAGGGHDVFLDHQASHVVGAEPQRHLPNRQSLRDPTGLQIWKIVEVEARHGQHLQVFPGAGLGAAGQGRIAG